MPLNGDQPAQAGGTLAYSNQVDLYAVPLQAGTILKVQNDVANLRVFDSSGHEIASQHAFLSTILFAAPSTGTYFVGVSSGGNLGYDPNASNSGAEGFAPTTYTLTLAFA